MQKVKIKPNPVEAYRQGHKNGMMDGFQASNNLFLLALDNVHDEIVPEENFAYLCKAIEKEMQRIFTDEMRGNISEIAVVAAHKIKKLRERLGMDENYKN